MPRIKRVDIQDNYYHILNRANARLKIFFQEEDYILFEKVLEEAWEIFDTRIIAYSIMPNHFHLVIHTQVNGELSKFMKWLTQTHTLRWHSKNETLGSGSLYQGRYKSFIIQDDNHLLTVIRYVERNPLTANLVKNPLNWKFSSLYRRYEGTKRQKEVLSEWPFQEPDDYLPFLKTPITEKEIEKLEKSEQKGAPFGDDEYVKGMVKKFNLGSTLRGSGRPFAT